MYYSEGYGRSILWWDEEAEWPTLRPVVDVFLPDWNEVDTTVRPMVDSLPGEIHSKVWKFDSHWTKEKLDRLLPDVLY